MPTTIQLPSRFTLEGLYPFTRNVVGADGMPADRHFIFDFRWLSFVDGTGLTVFCNTLEWLGSHGVLRTFINHDTLKAPTIYLDDCGFFSKYLQQNLRHGACVRNTTLPFTKVEHADAHGWLENTFTPWMSYAVGVPAAGLGSLRTCVKEVFNNIIDHSTLSTGYVHVQHYPNMRSVRVTMSDFGRGIPNSIRDRFGGMLDHQAILLASQPGVTSKTNPRNMGIGLDFLVEYVASNHGSVSIYSFRGSLFCNENGLGGVTRLPHAGNGSYPGTLVEITLPTDRFVGDEIGREEVEW